MRLVLQNRRRLGFIGIIVAVGLLALAGAAGLLATVISHGANQQTLDALSNPEASASDLAAISDQDLTNLRNDLPNQANLLTNFAGLGTPVLPNGGSTAEVAGNAIEELTRTVAEPAIINYMSDPASSWNAAHGTDRPADGTTPTGGVLPEDLPGGSGDVRLTLQWSAGVDLDLHVVDPCGNEISFRGPTATCQGGTGSLDVDDTVGGAGATENIFWPTGGAPSGHYEYWVHCYSGCDQEPASYTLSRTVDGRRVPTTGTLDSTGAESTHLTFSR